MAYFLCWKGRKHFFAASSVKKMSRFEEVSPEKIKSIAWKFTKTVILLGLAGYEPTASLVIYISSYPARPRRITVNYDWLGSFNRNELKLQGSDCHFTTYRRKVLPSLKHCSLFRGYINTAVSDCKPKCTYSYSLVVFSISYWNDIVVKIRILLFDPLEFVIPAFSIQLFIRSSCDTHQTGLSFVFEPRKWTDWLVRMNGKVRNRMTKKSLWKTPHRAPKLVNDRVRQRVSRYFVSLSIYIFLYSGQSYLKTYLTHQSLTGH